MSGTTEVPVTAGGGRADYPVLVGRGALARLPGLLEKRAPAHRYAVISDETVADLYGGRVLDGLADAGLDAELFTFPAGEESKTRDQWRRLTDALLEAGVARDGAVVAMGGGVTGDLAGFVAATFMRGIPVVQVPTSLVAMVDASVGGKTGVDVPHGKNLVGAFHPPRFVLADPEVITTLPRPERAQGLAEAVKHGAILDADYLDSLRDAAAALLDGKPGAVEPAVLRSVELKAGVVSRDEREGGLRQILNFGHTVAHALEAATGFGLAHGDAVAAGMVLEARLGEALGVTEGGTAATLEEILPRVELPVRPPGRADPDDVLAFMRTDKKGRAGGLRFVLLARPGQVRASEGRWVHEVSRDDLEPLVRVFLEDGPTPR